MGEVVRWFERRGEIPLTPPRAVREYAPLNDDPDRFDPESSLATISGVAFAIEYCDSRGWMSTRTIRCLAINPHHPACLTAFCHIRQRVQTFRVDRIISIVDLRSGRVVSSDGHLALLAPYMPKGESRDYLQPLFAFQEATRHGVFALLHLAMGEGRLDDAARDIVLSYVKEEAAAVGCAMPSAGLVELWIDNLSPPLEAVASAVTELLERKDKFARLLPWLLKVVRSRNSSAAEEASVRELMAEVRNHFRRQLEEYAPLDMRAVQ
jgi:hypothetical protein